MSDFLKNKLYLKKDGSINASKVVNSYVYNNHLKLHIKIIKFSNYFNIDVKPFSRLLYMYDNNIKSYTICKECNKLTKWLSFKKGFQTYCSNKCSSNCKDIINKKKNTCLDKYGVDNVFKAKDVKDKIKNTCLERYNKEHYSKTEEFNIKTKNTCQERYDKDHYSKTKEFKNDIKNTCLERYGVYHYSKTEDFIEKVKNTSLKKYNTEFISKTRKLKIKLNKHA